MSALSDRPPVFSDGHVEFPLNPGVRYAAWGMLSRHPQCDVIRSTIRRVRGVDAPDVPIVFERFAPRGYGYWLDSWMAVNPATAERIEILHVFPKPGDAADLIAKTMESLARGLRDALPHTKVCPSGCRLGDPPCGVCGSSD